MSRRSLRLTNPSCEAFSQQAFSTSRNKPQQAATSLNEVQESSRMLDPCALDQGNPKITLPSKHSHSHPPARTQMCTHARKYAHTHAHAHAHALSRSVSLKRTRTRVLKQQTLSPSHFPLPLVLALCVEVSLCWRLSNRPSIQERFRFRPHVHVRTCTCRCTATRAQRWSQIIWNFLLALGAKSVIFLVLVAISFWKWTSEKLSSECIDERLAWLHCIASKIASKIRSDLGGCPLDRITCTHTYSKTRHLME